MQGPAGQGLWGAVFGTSTTGKSPKSPGEKFMRVLKSARSDSSRLCKAPQAKAGGVLFSELRRQGHRQRPQGMDYACPEVSQAGQLPPVQGPAGQGWWGAVFRTFGDRDVAEEPQGWVYACPENSTPSPLSPRRRLFKLRAIHSKSKRSSELMNARSANQNRNTVPKKGVLWIRQSLDG